MSAQQKDTNALKKANVQLKEEVENLRTDTEKLSAEIVRLKTEKITLEQKNKELADRVLNKDKSQDNELHAKISDLQNKLDQEQSQVQRLRDEIIRLKESEEKQKELIKDERESRQILEQNIKQFGKVGKEHAYDQLFNEFQGYKEEKSLVKQELAKTKKELITLQGHMENIMAENRVLRNMFQVPDNYGFNLEEIKTGEKKKIEDYKSQVRYLEVEVEELEEERKILRHKLRNALKDKGGVDHQLDKMEYESDNKKRLQKQVEELTKQLNEIKEGRGESYLGGAHGGGVVSELSKDALEKIQKQTETQKEQMDKLMELMKNIQAGGYNVVQNNKNNYAGGGESQVQNVQMKQATGYQINHSNPNYGNVAEYNHHGIPPHPIPGSLGLGDTKEGYSNKFGHKIPVELNELYGEGGFDQVQAKHDIAQLQLINIELLKTLQEKEKEYQIHETEIDELKEELTQSLFIQDQLYEQHYAITRKKDDEISDLKNKVQELNENLKFVQTQYDVLEDFRKAIENQEKKFIEQKLSEQTKKMAVLEVNMIKLARKYQTLLEKFEASQKALTSIEDSHAEKIMYLSKTAQLLYNWKKQAQVDIKLLLEKLKDSVSGAEFRVISDKFQITQDKCIKVKTMLNTYRANEAKAQSVDRKLFDYQEQIRILEEEMVDMQMEGEFLKKRLSDLDPMYNKFLKIFGDMVQKFKSLKKSPIEIFNNFDENQDGLINQMEFSNILSELNITAATQDTDIIFKFMDTDGSGQLEYKEFIKKLRRQGVKIRDAQEQPIYELYESIQKNNMSLREAYDWFDKNKDNSITQQEMMEGFTSLKIQVPKETIERIFKMADISGDGAITFDEWRSLFETFLRETINQQDLVDNYELDWKKQAMVMIDRGLREQGYQLIDLYKVMDLEENQKISITEFKDLFSKVGIDWDIVKISTLFRDIDVDDSKTIEYNELLHYIKEAKKEEKRLEKLKKTAQMAEKLRSESNQVQQHIQYDVSATQTIEQKLQLKVATLELREKNLSNRNQMLRKQLNKVDKMNAQLQMRLDDLEQETIKSNRLFIQEKNKCIAMEQEYANSLKGQEAATLRTQNDKMQIEINELQQALQTFQNLYQVAYEQTLVSQMSRAKRDNEVEILQQTVRELESGSDDKSLYGKLKHLLMISRWQEGEIKKKYDKIYQENHEMQIKNENLQSEMKILEESFRTLNDDLSSRIKRQELEIAELKGKIIPTLNPYKIEELNNKLAEIFQMKLELEIANRQLREKNIELTFHCEYLEQTKVSLDKLKQDLNIGSKSHLEQRMLELQMKVQEITQAELKSKREALISREKEEFYQRLNRSYIDQIKSLENQIAEQSLKFTERENYHRTQMEKQLSKMNELSSKYSEAQLKETEGLADRLKQNVEQGKQIQFNSIKNAQFNKNDNNNNNKYQQPISQSTNKPTQDNRSQLDNNPEEIIQILEAQLAEKEKIIRELKQHNDNLIQEIEFRNKNEGEILGRQERMLAVTPGNIDQITKNAIAQESEKLTIAAQKTISTLQGLIEDKNEEIDKKDRLIERMRRDFLEDKQKDADEIRRLSNQLFRNNQNLAEKMTTNLKLSDNQVVENSAYWGDVGKLLQEKDQKLKEQQVLYETEQSQRKALKRRYDDLKEEFEKIQEELKEEQTRNQTEKLKPEIQTMRKLIKQKDVQLKKFQSALSDLQNEFAKATESKNDEQKNLKGLVIKETNNKLDLQKQLTDALQEVQKLNAKQEKHNSELKNMQKINANLEEDMKKQNELILEQKDHIDNLQQQLRELGKDIPVRADLEKKEKDLKIQKFLQGNQSQSLVEYQEKIKVLQTQLNKVTNEKNELLNKKEDIFDSNGNLRGRQIYFNDLQEPMKLISSWLAQNPKFNLIESLKSIDKEEKKLNPRKEYGAIKVSAFFDCLQRFSLKFKKEDQDFIESKLSAETGKINIVKFQYALKGQYDDQSVEYHKTAQTDQAFKASDSVQAPSHSQESDNKLSDKEKLIKQKLDQTKLELDKTQKELASSKDLVIKLEKELSLKRAQSAKNTQKTVQVSQPDTVPLQIVNDLKVALMEAEEKSQDQQNRLEQSEQMSVQLSKRIEHYQKQVRVLEEDLNKLMINELKSKQDLLKEARDERIVELESELKQLQNKQKQSHGIQYDNNGFIQNPRKTIYFESVDEIYSVIRTLVKKESSIQDFMGQIKQFDKLKKGLIPELSFKAILEKNLVKLKEQDFNTLKLTLQDRYSPNMVNIVQFYYALNGQVDDSNSNHHKSFGTDSAISSSSISGSNLNNQSGGNNMVDKKDLVELKKQNLELQKEIAILSQEKNQLLDIKGSSFDNKGYLKAQTSYFLNSKEIISTIKEWLRQNPSFDVFSELKKYDYDQKGQVSSQDFYRALSVFSIRLQEKDQQTLDKTLKDRYNNVDLVKFYYLLKGNVETIETLTEHKGQEKINMYKMEDHIDELKLEIKKLTESIQSEQEEKQKNLEEIKFLKAEQLSMKQKYDDVVRNKIGNDKLIKEFKESNDKDAIIVRLKKNLDQVRDKEAEYQFKVTNLEKQIKDLNHYKEQFEEIQEKYNRRLMELDEGKKQKDANKTPNQPQMKTLKKPINQLIKK